MMTFSEQDLRWKEFQVTYGNALHIGFATLVSDCKSNSLEKQKNACFILRKLAESSKPCELIEDIVRTGILKHLIKFLNPDAPSATFMTDVLYFLADTGIFFWVVVIWCVSLISHF